MTAITSVPPWSYPFILALVGIILLVGHLSLLAEIITSTETTLFVVYLITRSYRKDLPRSTANLLPLFPAHLLVLLIISLLPQQREYLPAVWMAIPPATVLYDLVNSKLDWTNNRAKRSILSGLYCIIWASVFFLLERSIAIRKMLASSVEIYVVIAFCFVGVSFLSLGVYRHLHAK